MSLITTVKKHKQLLLCVLVALVFFGGGFLTSSLVATASRPSGGPGGQMGSNGAMPNGQRPSDDTTGSNANTTTGTVVSNSDEYITIKLSSGSTKIVHITSDTTVNTLTKSSSSALSAGTTISVEGTTNSDNSISGTTITIGE